MRHRLIQIAIALGLMTVIGCSADEPIHHPIWSGCYLAHGVEGSMLVYDYTNDQWHSGLPHRDTLRFLPASTFKIFNTLVALETGVIESDSTVLPWDSTEYWWDMYNRDHDLRSAFRYSALWYYQRVAKEVGRERMQSYIDDVGYGNEDISGAIDSFWLNGGLRISPKEQIEFLVQVYENDLPFSQRSIDILKSIMIRDSTDSYILRHKTGWATVEPNVGWLVGWVERNDGMWFFASNVVGGHDAVGQARTDVALKILREEGMLPK